MSKKAGVMKGRHNFTIDESIFEEFREHCTENCINMSAKIESYLKKELRK